MKLDRRLLIAAAAILLCLLAASTLGFPRDGRHAWGAAVAPDESAAGGAGAGHASSAAFRRHAQEGQRLTKDGLPVQPASAGSDARSDSKCEACRQEECSNYEGSGLDMVSGCFEQVDGLHGADERDPQFVADCTAVVRCAMDTRCAESPAGPAACYCGTRDVDACIELGPSADAPCVEQWRRAARTRDHHELTQRFSDLKYPAGWASSMLDCERRYCSNSCTRGGRS